MKYLFSLIVILFLRCNSQENQNFVSSSTQNIPPAASVYIKILGTVQDAGAPHIGCQKKCCASRFKTPNPHLKVVSLGLIDTIAKKTFLFEATPDISEQIYNLHAALNSNKKLPDGIFITHAHIGHYSGLMYLGREATNAKALPTYVMPKMKEFLTNNGPWNQLISLNNIHLNTLKADTATKVTANISITPLLVPHRDEFSETVGYRIKGPHKTALFIPDIDKWEHWNRDIIEEINKVDYALLDATFFDGAELNTRDISEIPHPFVVESLNLFESLPYEEKKKVFFIHFNHTNSMLEPSSSNYKKVIDAGFNIAQYDQILNL